MNSKIQNSWQSRKVIINNATKRLFNKQARYLYNEYNTLSRAEKSEFCLRYNISDLFLDDYHYSDWFLSQLEAD